jgi:hypothetical protein
MSTNRIGGDYNLEALEAFRAAYGQQLMTPQEHDIDARTGLPTENISNTSPWLATTGIWRYPSGKGPESDLRAPFNPQEFITQTDDEINLDEMTEAELDAYLDTLSEDELVALSQQFDSEEEVDTSGEMSDAEIDALIEELIDNEG